jgi:hypothetical protein
VRNGYSQILPEIVHELAIILFAFSSHAFVSVKSTDFPHVFLLLHCFVPASNICAPLLAKIEVDLIACGIVSSCNLFLGEVDHASLPAM